jgi:hypothetical protein
MIDWCPEFRSGICRCHPIDSIESEKEDFRGHTTRLGFDSPKTRRLLIPHDFVNSGFITLDTKEAAWVNPETKSVHKIRTKHGFCLAPTLIGASLS